MKQSLTILTKLFIAVNMLLLPLSMVAQCPADIVVPSGTTDVWVNTASDPASVRITAVGAGGGTNTGGSFAGGTGASVAGTFTVAPGATLLLIAGAPGGSSPSVGGGGGGASGAVNCGDPLDCSTGTILIIAGGGGGGSFLTNGTGGQTLGGSGGGGANSGSAGGGGGLNAPGDGGGDGAGGGGEQVSQTDISLGGGPGTNGAAGGDGMGGGGGTGPSSHAGGGGGQTGGDAETGGGTPAQGGNSLNTGDGQSGTNGSTGGGATAGSVTVQCLGLLPVELVDFSAALVDAAASLSWRTASELNNAGFEVERSENGADFRRIGWVDGNGTTAEQQAYSYHDKDLRQGKTYYYRLRQVDHDGQFELSPVRTVRTGGKGAVVGEFYPNPAANGGLVRLDFTATEESGTWQVKAFDVMGSDVSHFQHLSAFEAPKGDHTILFNFEGLSTGLYFVEMANGNERFYRKLVIE